MNHLVTLRIIVEEFFSNKIDLSCGFSDFRKAFSAIPRKESWKRLEELIFPMEFKYFMERLYETHIANFMTTQGCLEESICNIGVK